MISFQIDMYATAVGRLPAKSGNNIFRKPAVNVLLVLYTAGIYLPTYLTYLTYEPGRLTRPQKAIHRLPNFSMPLLKHRGAVARDVDDCSGRKRPIT